MSSNFSTLHRRAYAIVFLLPALLQFACASPATDESTTSSFVAAVANLPPADAQTIPGNGDFWAVRAAYPTGRFEPTWLRDAAVADRDIRRGIPAGRVPKRSVDAQRAINLPDDQFTALGPQPLQTDGCQSCFSFGRVAGRTNVIISDPVDPTIAYVGSDGGGVWKTTDCCDADTTWQPVTDDPLLASIAIGDLTFDPNDSDTIYAGTGDLRYGSWSFGSAGLLKTTDAGATWTLLGEDVFDPIYTPAAGTFPQYQAIGKVRVDPRNSDNVVVGTKTGLFFSYDGGANWDGPCLTNALTTQRQDTTGLALRDDVNETTVYAAIGTRGTPTPVQPDLGLNGANGIYQATMPVSGCPATWTLVTRPDNGWPAGTGSGTPFPTNTIGRIDLAMAPSDGDVIYAQVANISTRGLLGVWRTIDGGATWQQRANVADLTGCFGDWPQNWYDQGVTIDPTDPDNVFMSTVDLFRSTNGGDTFVNLTCGYAGAADDVHVDHHAIAVVGGDGDRLLVGSDGGVWYTGNALANPATAPSFTQLNNSLATIEFYSGDITANFAHAANPGINAGAQDNGSSVHVWSGPVGPAEWNMTTGGDGMYARIEPVLGQRWYQESQNGGLKRSSGGPFGTYVSAAGPWGGDRLSFIMPYELYKYDCPPTGCTHMIAGTHRVWETIQGAIPTNSWHANSPDLTKGTLGSRSFIQQLSHAVSDSSVVIAGTLDGNVQMGFGMGQGIANSATWVDLTGTNAVLPNRPVMDVTTDPLVPTTGYAALGGFDDNTPATPGHVFRVTCNADCSTFNWEDKSGNLPNIPANTILANPNIPQQVFVGTDWGLYFTDDIEAVSPVWMHFSAGLPRAMVWDMAIDRGFTTLALFTRSRGAYAWPLPTNGLFSDGFETGDTSMWDVAVP